MYVLFFYYIALQFEIFYLVTFPRWKIDPE